VPADRLPETGTKTLDETKSAGRFPAGLAVVQVVTNAEEEELEAGTSPAKPGLLVAHTANERRAYWNDLLGDLPALREVRLLRSTALDPRGTQCRDILRRSVTEHCNLCLIYAQASSTEADSEYIASLWDAAAGQPLAVYRAPVTIPHCERQYGHSSDSKDAGSHDKHAQARHETWFQEADFRAEADLRRMVRDSIWDLASRDQTKPTTEPNPWQTDRPILPRDMRMHLFEIPTRKDH
jgi:hypothetical protein